MLAVHGGVGSKQKGIEKECAAAVRSASLDVVKAVMHLEAEGITNCGLGSSLTADGTVECEAGWMTSKCTTFGAVAALTNTRHPSLLAKKVADRQLHSNFALIPAMLVVGEGANRMAEEAADVPTCSNEQLVTTRSKEELQRTQTLLQADGTWDTVGAISIKVSGTNEGVQ
ncbi:Asparaginase [Aphelenchoides fujianensis]|nr:Asparaginase [Aphelenchoides fujianensis]